MLMGRSSLLGFDRVNLLFSLWQPEKEAQQGKLCLWGFSRAISR